MSKIYHTAFGIVPNNLLNNTDISLKAKGLFAYLQSKPSGWDFTLKGIVSQVKENIDAVRAGVKELELAGYLVRKNYQNEKGQWDCDYNLYLEPTESQPLSEKPHWEKPHTVFPHTENAYTKERKNKKERIRKKEVAEPPLQNRDKLFQIFNSVAPKLTQHPHYKNIVESVESRPFEDQEAFIRYVVGNKTADKQLQARGWTDWYWADYWTEKHKKDTKVSQLDKEDIEFYKKHDINPYGKGKWADRIINI